MSGHRHLSGETGVSLSEELMQPVDLGGHRVHDGLAVGGAVVEEQVQQGVVGEVPQSADAGEGDLLDVPDTERET